MTAVTAVPAERARSILGDLVRQRQLMRGDSADDGLLEANRLAIVYWQWQLTRFFFSEYEHAERAA